MDDSSTLVALQAGDHVMKVHASVLADNSDYFKAVVLSGRWPVTPLLVPFVHPAALVRLVQFMYSRHMDVDQKGVQDVLLAARLLGMPNAVTACQDILARHGLARPRPFPWIWAPAMTPAWSTATDTYRSQWAIGSSVGPQPLQLPLHEQNEVSSSRPPQIQQLNPHITPSSFNSMVHTDASPQENFGGQEQDKPASECSESSALNSPCPSLDRVKVVIDVAWCDGPVRFQRVLNDNCDGLEDHNVSKRPKKTSKRLGASNHPKAIATELDTAVAKNDENKASSSARSKYNCLYCNLSFKSHHCYAKHKRRHLNPCIADSETSLQTEKAEPKTTLEGPNQNREVIAIPKDHFSLAAPTKAASSLELNVPFYPCKACGSKFPSYYFVHKHSKVCDGIKKIAQDEQSEGVKRSETENAK